MAKKNRIFSSDKEYRSTYYFKPSSASVWRSSDEMKGEKAHKRIQVLIDKMTTKEKRAFRDYYEGIQDDDGSYVEYDLENLFAIGDKYFAGEDIIEFISTLDDLPEGLA